MLKDCSFIYNLFAAFDYFYLLPWDILGKIIYIDLSDLCKINYFFFYLEVVINNLVLIINIGIQ